MYATEYRRKRRCQCAPAPGTEIISPGRKARWAGRRTDTNAGLGSATLTHAPGGDSRPGCGGGGVGWRGVRSGGRQSVISIPQYGQLTRSPACCGSNCTCPLHMMQAQVTRFDCPASIKSQPLFYQRPPEVATPKSATLPNPRHSQIRPNPPPWSRRCGLSAQFLQSEPGAKSSVQLSQIAALQIAQRSADETAGYRRDGTLHERGVQQSRFAPESDLIFSGTQRIGNGAERDNDQVL